MRRPFLLLASLLLIGCAGPADAPGGEPRIVVGRAAGGSEWRATFHLAAPATRLRFQRTASFYREEVWRVLTPGWSFARDDGDQLLVADEGRPATDTITVGFPVYTDNLPKEYELFGEFTDGSVALYTGHFYVTSGDPRGEDGAEGAEVLRRLELVPAEGERLVIQGEVSSGRTVWEDPHEDGTYAYFGTIAPLETEAMLAIVDPGAPTWLVERLNRMLPALFAEYARGFGVELPWKPFVLFSFHDVDRPGLESGGGTLTGLIQMSATGRDWNRATPESAEHLLHLIAHEAAHLWNGQIHAYEDPADSWMHEGSADAFAEALLLRHGAIDAERLAERRSEALGLCAMGLAEGPLSGSYDRQQFRNTYTCGNAIAFWSAAAVSGQPGLEPLFGVWRRLFELSAPAAGRYDRGTYLAALGELGASPEIVARLEAFLDDHPADPARALIDLFGAVGIRLETPERPIPQLRRESAAAVVQQLMGTACDGRYSFHREGARLRTAAIEGCEPFARELRVVAIEGHPIREAGDLALAAARRRCAQGQPVALGLEGGGVERVPCSSPPAAPPLPLAFPPPQREAAGA